MIAVGGDRCWGDHCSSWGGGGQLTIAVEMITVEVIAVEVITVEVIAVEAIAVEAIAVHPGGVNWQSLLRWSLLRWLLLRQLLLRQLLLRWLLLRWSLLRQSLLRQLLFIWGGVNQWSLLRWSLFILGGDQSTITVETSLLRQSLLRAIAVETIAVEVIAVEAITVEMMAVHPRGGSIDACCWGDHCSSWGVRADWWSLLRQSLLRWSLLKQLLLRGSTQNCIMGIVRCIMGNAFCSTTDLQVPSVCTSFVKFGIYWEKNKEDRLVHNHEISVPPPDIPCEARVGL